MNTHVGFLTLFHSDVEPLDFDTLYRKEIPRVYNFFRLRVGDSCQAEDLTSATFEKAWRGRHRFRDDGIAFATWLFTIARRVLIDHYRTQKKVVSLDAFNEIPADETTEDVIHKRADFARLTILLSQLADRDRELVALRFGAGLTNRAIARLTGLSESNVGVVLHRAVQKLRQQWQEGECEEKENEA